MLGTGRAADEGKHVIDFTNVPCGTKLLIMLPLMSADGPDLSMSLCAMCASSKPCRIPDTQLIHCSAAGYPGTVLQRARGRVNRALQTISRV